MGAGGFQNIFAESAAEKKYGKGNYEAYQEKYTDKNGFIKSRTSYRKKQNLSSSSATDSTTSEQRKTYTRISSLLGG